MCMTNRFRFEANLRNVQWLSLPRIFSALNLDVEGAIAAAEQNGVGILGRKNRLKRSQHSMPPRKSVVLHPHHLISSPWTSHHGAEIKFDRDARQARQISPDLVRPVSRKISHDDVTELNRSGPGRSQTFRDAAENENAWKAAETLDLRLHPQIHMYFIIVLSYFILSSLLHSPFEWPPISNDAGDYILSRARGWIMILDRNSLARYATAQTNQSQLGLMRQTQLLSHQLASPGCVRKWSQNLPLGK